MRKLIVGIATLALLASVACASDTGATTDSAKSADKIEKRADSTKVETEKWVTSKTGLKTLDTKIGTGAEAKMGQTVMIHYTVWLWVNNAKGKKIDSSVDKGQPLKSTLGNGQMIKGYDEGIVGMKEGGTRTIIVPSELGWGANGIPGVIPPNTAVTFEVELVQIAK